jgi:hypothetical protein
MRLIRRLGYFLRHHHLEVWDDRVPRVSGPDTYIQRPRGDGVCDGRDPDCRVTLDGEAVGTMLVSRNYLAVLGISLDRGPGLDRSETDPDDAP